MAAAQVVSIEPTAITTAFMFNEANQYNPGSDINAIIAGGMVFDSTDWSPQPWRYESLGTTNFGHLAEPPHLKTLQLSESHMVTPELNVDIPNRWTVAPDIKDPTPSRLHDGSTAISTAPPQHFTMCEEFIDTSEPKVATHSLRRGIKRCRTSSDVDSSNAAALGRKKRRPRLRRVSSRLSLPYSESGSDCTLNQDVKGINNNGLSRCEAPVSLGQRSVETQAASIHKYTLMNCLRQRLGKDGQKISPNGSPCLRNHAASNAAKASQQQLCLNSTRMTQVSRPSAVPSSCSIEAMHSISESSPSVPCAYTHNKTSPRPPKTKTVSLPSDVPAAKESSSSAQMWSSLVWSYEEYDEDSLAFLYEDDDDPDQVYCDFGAIFKGTSLSPSSPDGLHYEDYLDGLDGVCWSRV